MIPTTDGVMQLTAIDNLTLLHSGEAPDHTNALPLLYQRREAVVLDPRMGSTTTCQTTAASDYTPDD